MSPEWICLLDRVQLGFVNNKPTKFVLFCLGTCCSHYFKQLDNLQKVIVNLSLCNIKIRLYTLKLINPLCGQSRFED